MIIDHVKVFTEDKKFTDGGIVIKNGTIEQVYTEGKRPQTEDEVLDGKGMYAIPGLIDLHFHGCKGDDFCDGSRDAIARIAEYEASVGVTAIAPATMTLPVEELEQILRVAAEYKKGPHSKKEADFVGINMEGPFISPAKKGAQDERNIIPCDVKVCERFLEVSEGLVKFMGIAPEKSENAVSFIEAFNAGADHAVHLYNAMPAFTHRAPGVIGAVYDSKHVMAEIICDGVHIHPAAVRATFEMMGEDRMILISDSMRAAGMPDGSYTLGGLDVNVVGNRATLASDGAIAGSVTNLMDCMKTAVKTMNIPLETAVACATINPAKSLGIDAEYGSIRAGKKAHIVLMDQELNVQQVIKDGELL